MGIAVSAGSACSSNHGNNASHVLQAIGLNPFEARGSIRVSLGRFTIEQDIDALMNALNNTVMQLNSIFS
jgi:cysteine desulfurase